MEADWSAEIGPGLPLIEASWDGFVDLRRVPEEIDAIEEARRYSAMREALLSLNDERSPVFTTKCDCWTLAQEEIDPDEFAASRETARAGFASYIDVVDRDPVRFASSDYCEHRTRELTSHLRALEIRHGRVDLVLRSAVQNERAGFAITLYAAGCGATDVEAYAAWRAVLAAAVAATMAEATHLPRTGE